MPLDSPETYYIWPHIQGVLAEWLGRALQKLAQRFESARRLNKPLLYEGFNFLGRYSLE